MEEKKIEEQIDEMAKVLKDYTKDKGIMASHVILDDYAEALYNAGYRKQSEIIDEFAELIKKDFTDYPKLTSWLDISEEGFCGRIDELVAEMKGGAE